MGLRRHQSSVRILRAQVYLPCPSPGHRHKVQAQSFWCVKHCRSDPHCQAGKVVGCPCTLPRATRDSGTRQRHNALPARCHCHATPSRPEHPQACPAPAARPSCVTAVADAPSPTMAGPTPADKSVRRLLRPIGESPGKTGRSSFRTLREPLLTSPRLHQAHARLLSRWLFGGPSPGLQGRDRARLDLDASA
jgi:hypothetical protein